MRIKTNNFFGGTKSIEVVNTCIIAKDGPNMVSKFSLAGLNIKYDSVFTSKQTLKSGGVDTPIMYGFLGTNITFLAIVPTYGGNNPMSCSGASNYVEYYFEDNPLVRRTFTDILVLSGDANHRIPQVFVYNPTAYSVTLDIMVANLDENEISTSLVPTYSTIKGLSYSSIRTDQVYMVSCSTGCTGSTQFEIYDINNNLEMVIPFNKIDIIQINNELLTVKTHSHDDIQLYFLSAFNALQTLSRMNWVMESSINRYLSATYPGLDTTPPVITFKAHSIPQPMSYISGVITKADLLWRFIDNVKDYDDDGILRDGQINNADLGVLIVKLSTGEQFEKITTDGTYAITFTAKDLAGNSTSSTKTIVVDGTAPTIVWNSGITNTMDLTGDTQTPGTILKDDIRRYYINYVWDDVDGIIPNSAVTVMINSGNITYTGITQIGYYDVDFSVFDTAGNEASAYTLLHVIESVPPVIYYNNVFTGNTFSMTTGVTGLTANEVRDYAINTVIDNYDGAIAVSNVIVSGTTFPIITTGSYDITFSVSDSSGNETTDTKQLTTTN